jgi:hypothetical protein
LPPIHHFGKQLLHSRMFEHEEQTTDASWTIWRLEHLGERKS